MALDLTTEERDGEVLVVSFRNPKGRGNALTPEDARSLADHLHLLFRNEGCAAVVLRGAQHFCAGADLADVPENVRMGDNLRRYWGPLSLTVDTAPVPVVAAIDGVAAGGGLSLALACHARVMATTATLIPGFLQVGLVPDAGASYHLARLLGVGPAFRWLASGEAINSDVAQSWGLVDAVAAPDAVDEAAVHEARALACPDAPLKETWKLLQRSIGGDLAAAIEMEASVQDRLGRESAFRNARERFMNRH